jgi:hypothetical protein
LAKELKELSMTVCPKCGYERTTNDNNFVSAEECPKCGIFYKKWNPSSISNNSEPILTSSEEPNISKEKKTIQYNSIILAALIFIVLAIAAKFIFFTRNESPRLVSTLPASPFRTAGTSWIIRASGNEETITAAGQLFKPPSQTPGLFKLGFLFTQFSFTKKVPDFKLQVILSEWYGDRPSPTALWVSEPRTIPKTTEDYQADWIEFDVPHLTLDPKKLYIAWITLSGLENLPDASVGISYSNESGAGSPYPGGMYTFYKQANPDGDVSQMINSAWEVHDVGHNLNFRMTFENSINEHDKKDLENDDSKNRLNEVIQQKTNGAIIQRKEKEQQKREEMKQQQVDSEIQQQEKNERRQVEIEQQQAERERQQEESDQQRKRQQVETEIQQYERERQQEEMKQKQDEMRQQQSDRMNMEPRRVQRIPRRR